MLVKFTCDHWSHEVSSMVRFMRHVGHFEVKETSHSLVNPPLPLHSFTAFIHNFYLLLSCWNLMFFLSCRFCMLLQPPEASPSWPALGSLSQSQMSSNGLDTKCSIISISSAWNLRLRWPNPSNWPNQASTYSKAWPSPLSLCSPGCEGSLSPSLTIPCEEWRNQNVAYLHCS